MDRASEMLAVLTGSSSLPDAIRSLAVVNALSSFFSISTCIFDIADPTESHALIHYIDSVLLSSLGLVSFWIFGFLPEFSELPVGLYAGFSSLAAFVATPSGCFGPPEPGSDDLLIKPHVAESERRGVQGQGQGRRRRRKTLVKQCSVGGSML